MSDEPERGAGPDVDDRSGSARTGPEWVTFAVSLLVLAVVVGLLVVQMLTPEEPAEPVAESGVVEQTPGGRFRVPVEVRNRGDVTAAAVQVTATLTIDDEVTEAEQTIDFLAGGEVEDVVFVFDDDPATGQLEVRVASYAEP